VAVGAAAILGTSVAVAARDVLAWVLARDGEAQQSKRQLGGRQNGVNDAYR